MKFFKKFLLKSVLIKIFGGGKRDRTADLLHAMQALSQLSYTPITPTNLGFKLTLIFRATQRRRNINDAAANCQRLVSIYAYFSD